MIGKIEALLKRHNVPGVSIAIVAKNQIVWAEGVGFCTNGEPTAVSSDTLFQACSISKALTAVATLRLVESGQLALDTDINHYLRTWQLPAHETWQPQITLRQLLSHTAGITVPWFAGYHRDQQLPTLLQILHGDRPSNTPAVRVNILPGSRYRYSGGGYCIVQQILCDVTGEAFPSLMDRLVLAPAEMQQSTYTQPLPQPQWAAAATAHRADGAPLAGRWHLYPEMAAAGLWTTASDLARFAIALQRAQAGEPNALLSSALMQTMLTPQAEAGAGRQMGLGIWLEGQGPTLRFGHPGDNEGYACRWVSCNNGQGVVIMTNSDNGWLVIEELLAQIAQDYYWPALDSTESLAPPSANPHWLAYAGSYELMPHFLLQVEYTSDALWLAAPNQPQLQLFPLSGRSFRLDGLDGEVTFLTAADGTVNGLQLQQDGQIQQAHKRH